MLWQRQSIYFFCEQFCRIDVEFPMILCLRQTQCEGISGFDCAGSARVEKFPWRLRQTRWTFVKHLIDFRSFSKQKLIKSAQNSIPRRRFTSSTRFINSTSTRQHANSIKLSFSQIQFIRSLPRGFVAAKYGGEGFSLVSTTFWNMKL